ncbi:MAG: cation:proton antiporter [Devosiaceae bacterium]|nr:cation:proton antiporter [Devosiaceae bacterium MH13]
MSTEAFLQGASIIAMAIILLAFLIISARIIMGPTLPDRVLGLDMLVAAGIGFIAVVAIKTGFFLYLDIAIALGLVGFLATVAFARFILRRDRPLQEDEDLPPVHAPRSPEDSR